MHIPEWEIEELLAQYPELLGLPSKRLELVERQKYLGKSGRYIDLLFKREDGFVIAEIKSTLVDDESVISNQLLPYRSGLANELGITEDKILCVLISPNGFSESVKKLCREAGIITRTIDPDVLVETIRNLNLKNWSEYKEFSTTRARRELSSLFAKISEKAPIQAHEVGTESNGKLTTNRDMWFWFFYSVMDRRASAATFVKAKEALERERLFAPYKIVKLVKTKGEKAALNKIARILEDFSFPLLSDKVMGKLSFPKSIIDAARFMSGYNYDFVRLYEDYVKTSEGNLSEARDLIWRDLKKKIYGVGPRIASQIIRGLVIKGPWEFPLDDNRFLEECRFNVWIAGKTRLNLIGNESEYYDKLGKLADDFLNGNRGIIAHVLWYIRKRYCSHTPKCDECLVAGHCLHAPGSSL